MSAQGGSGGGALDTPEAESLSNDLAYYRAETERLRIQTQKLKAKIIKTDAVIQNLRIYRQASEEYKTRLLASEEQVKALSKKVDFLDAKAKLAQDQQNASERAELVAKSRLEDATALLAAERVRLGNKLDHYEEAQNTIKRLESQIKLLSPNRSTSANHLSADPRADERGLSHAVKTALKAQKAAEKAAAKAEQSADTAREAAEKREARLIAMLTRCKDIISTARKERKGLIKKNSALEAKLQKANAARASKTRGRKSTSSPDAKKRNTRVRVHPTETASSSSQPLPRQRKRRRVETTQIRETTPAIRSTSSKTMSRREIKQELMRVGQGVVTWRLWTCIPDATRAEMAREKADFNPTSLLNDTASDVAKDAVRAAGIPGGSPGIQTLAAFLVRLERARGPTDVNSSVLFATAREAMRIARTYGASLGARIAACELFSRICKFDSSQSTPGPVGGVAPVRALAGHVVNSDMGPRLLFALCKGFPGALTARPGTCRYCDALRLVCAVRCTDGDDTTRDSGDTIAELQELGIQNNWWTAEKLKSADFGRSVRRDLDALLKLAARCAISTGEEDADAPSPAISLQILSVMAGACNGRRLYNTVLRPTWDAMRSIDIKAADNTQLSTVCWGIRVIAAIGRYVDMGRARDDIIASLRAIVQAASSPHQRGRRPRPNRVGWAAAAALTALAPGDSTVVRKLGASAIKRATMRLDWPLLADAVAKRRISDADCDRLMIDAFNTRTAQRIERL